MLWRTPTTVQRLEAAYRRARPVPRLAAEPLGAAGHGRPPGRARLPHHRAQPAAGRARSIPASPRPRRSGSTPQPTPAWIEAFCAAQPGQAGASRHHAAHAGGDRRAGRASPSSKQAGRPMAMAIGVVEGDHMGLFDVLVMPQARRRGLARQDHRKPLCLGVRRTARASPICRSSPPTTPRCRSMPRKASAPSTTTNIVSRLHSEPAP